MTDPERIAGVISAECDGRWNMHYVRGKIKTDPLYEAVVAELKGSELPLLDIGCGMGFLAMYLREKGWSGRVDAFDFDSRKITGGSRLIKRLGYEDITLHEGDAREAFQTHAGNVTILDILQYMDEPEQEALLRDAAERVSVGGKLVIRNCLRGRNGRFFTTMAMDFFARFSFWMKSSPRSYPTRSFLERVLSESGLEVTVAPLWGGTPFNNYLVVGKRVK